MPGLSPAFADFLFILAGSDCLAMGVDVVVENPCDPWGRAHNYGLYWLNIGKLGLTREDATWLGLTINAVFLLSALIIISPSSAAELFIALLFLISPAVMLGLERANADLIIFTLLALCFYCIYSSHIILNILACLLLFFSAILKLYPVVMLPVLMFYFSANKTKFSLLLATLLLFILYMCLNWSDVSRLIGVIPNITWHYSMGGELLFSRLGYELDHTTRNLTYCLAAVALVSGIMWGCRANMAHTGSAGSGPQAGWTGMLFLSGAVLVVFSFIIKNSFDYRNIFFLFLLPCLLKLVFNQDNDTRLKFVPAAILMVYGFLLWAEFLVSMFNDVPGSAEFIRILESLLNWIIVVPIVMMAMQVAIINADASWLMRSLVIPLQKLLGTHSGNPKHE